MKINASSSELLRDFTQLSFDKFCSGTEAIGQSKLDELELLPHVVVEASLALSFFSPTEMQKINKQYREVDAATDVLSFPMWEDETGHFTPPADWEELPLGDLIICPEIVAKNAIEHGKSFEQELALVLFHGLLHLCGYDHDTEERRAEMWKLQEEMVSRLIKNEE